MKRNELIEKVKAVLWSLSCDKFIRNPDDTANELVELCQSHTDDESIHNATLDEVAESVENKLYNFEQKQGVFADQAVVEVCRDIAKGAIEQLKKP